jgi:hypothetical protein
LLQPPRRTGQERKGAYEYQRDLGSPVSPLDDVGDCADQLCQSSLGRIEENVLLHPDEAAGTQKRRVFDA